MPIRCVLVSDATSYKAVVVASFLKERYPGLRVLTCDWRRGSRILHTRRSDQHFVLRQGTGAGRAYVEELSRLCRDVGADLLLPINSAEMDLVVRAREAFDGRLAYLGEAAAYERLHRKDRLATLARESGVRVPEAFADEASVRVPAVAKPVAASSARGVHYLSGEADRARFRATRPSDVEYIFQEFVAGEGVGYSLFAREGRVLVGHGHRRLAEFPTRGGSSVYRESFDDPAMTEAAGRLVARTRWSGFAMFEFKRTPANELYLLECNPRIWGSIHQGLLSGANYFEPLLGPAAPAGATRDGVRTYLSPLIYAALAGYAARGDFRPWREFFGGLARNRADVSPWRDPGGWLGFALRVA